MVVQVDTREHKKEWERIQKQFECLGVQYFRSKLYCGDYQSLNNAKLCIPTERKTYRSYVGMYASSMRDLKQNLSEHVRPAYSSSYLWSMGADIKTMGDVYFWENPRKHRVIWRTVNGKKVRSVQYQKKR